GLVREARKAAQLRLATHRMMEAQIVSGLCHEGIQRGIAGEAEDVLRIVVFRPFNGLDAAVVAVAAPDDAGVRPMSPHALRNMLSGVPTGPSRTREAAHHLS